VASRDDLLHYLADHDARCPACGYQLRRLRSDRCPECGQRLELGVVGHPLADTRPLLLLVVPAAAAFVSGVYWAIFIGQELLIDPTGLTYSPIDFLIAFALLLCAIPLTLGVAFRATLLALPPDRQWVLARVGGGYAAGVLAIDLIYNGLSF
jgi:hypothetical protein